MVGTQKKMNERKLTKLVGRKGASKSIGKKNRKVGRKISRDDGNHQDMLVGRKVD